MSARRAGAPDPPDETNSEDHSERFEASRRGAPSGLLKIDHAGTGRLAAKPCTTALGARQNLAHLNTIATITGDSESNNSPH